MNFLTTSIHCMNLFYLKINYFDLNLNYFNFLQQTFKIIQQLCIKTVNNYRQTFYQKRFSVKKNYFHDLYTISTHGFKGHIESKV